VPKQVLHGGDRYRDKWPKFAIPINFSALLFGTASSKADDVGMSRPRGGLRRGAEVTQSSGGDVSGVT